MPPGFDILASLESGVALHRHAVDFIDDARDYRAAAVVSTQRLQEIGYDRDVAQGAMASLDAIQGLPVVGNVVKVISRVQRGGSVRCAAGRNGPVRIIMPGEAVA